MTRTTRLTSPTHVFLLALALLPRSGSGQNIVAWGTSALTNVPASATNVVAVSGGIHHALALRADGTVVGWGTGPEAVVPANATNIITISAGYMHSVALRQDGTVLVWGNNNNGQLQVPPDAINLVAISARGYSTLAIRADTTLTGWSRTYGYTWDQVVSNVLDISSQVVPPAGLLIGDYSLVLFDGGRLAEATQRTVSGSSNPMGQIQAISEGIYQSLGIRPGGQVVATKPRFPAMPANATNAVLIAAGANDHMAVSARGELIAWGRTSLTNVPSSATNLIDIFLGTNYALAVVGNGAPPKVLGRSPVAYRTYVPVGSPLPLYVRAVGNQPLHYEWLADGVPIPDTDTPFPQIPAQRGTDNVQYSVRVYNDYGSVTTAAAKVAVGDLYAWGDNRRSQGDYPLDLTNALAVAAGAFHALGLREDGTVCAWGKNADGQTSVPAGLSGVTAVAAGGDHSLALKSDGSVVGWGRNWDGQATVPADAVNVRAITAGWAHSLALRSDGRVVAWGNNDYGQLEVALLPTDLIGIAAGYFHSAGLRANGTVITWGWDVPVPSSATNIVSIAAGWEHCLALRTDGTVVAWGDNTFGQSAVPAEATNVVQISAGYYHNLARRADGTVIAWGRNAFGATTISPFLKNASWVAAGEDYSLALIGSGLPQVVNPPASVAAHIGETRVLSARILGAFPLSYQWFHGDNVIPGATNAWLVLQGITDFDAGTYSLWATNLLGSISVSATLTVLQAPHSEITTSSQRVLPGGSFCLQATASGADPLTYQWQLNGTNLVEGPNFSGTTSTTLCVTGSRFGDTGAYSLVIRNQYGAITTLVAQVTVSTILAWGDNSAGQLNVPPGETDVRQISSGALHNLLLRGDGTVVAWGDNSFGQSTVPAAATNIVSVAAGAQHSLALRQDGTVLAWGDNSRGQTTLPSFPATPVAIACADFFNMVLLSNGKTVVWGMGWSGSQTPQGTNLIALGAGGSQAFGLKSDHNLVTFIPAATLASDVVAFVGGSRHLLALRGSGVLVGSGNNLYGQRTIPEQATNIVSFAAGGDHSLALLKDGSVVGWGANYAGQIDIPPAGNLAIRSLHCGAAHSLALTSAGLTPHPLAMEVFHATNGPAMVRLSGLSGIGPSVVYASEELVGWSAMATNPPAFGPIQYLDYPQGNRFYRAAEQR